MNHCTKRQALSICGGVLLLTALSPSLAHAQACYNYTTTYATFQASNFSSLNGAQLNPVAGPGTVQMVAGALAMTPESIILPFDQEVKVRFLNENSANSGTLGWFYYDQISGKFVSGGALTDIDGDGVKDWFQPKKAVAPTRANDGLFLQTAGVPMLTIGTAFTDGTPFTSPTPTFPRIPNVISSAFWTWNASTTCGWRMARNW